MFTRGLIHSHILRSRKHEGNLSDDISLACNLKVGTTEGRTENGLQILQLAVGPDHQLAGCIEARAFGRLLLVRLVLSETNELSSSNFHWLKLIHPPFPCNSMDFCSRMAEAWPSTARAPWSTWISGPG